MNEVIQHTAEMMLAELERERLVVVLIPSRDVDCAMRGGKIRAVESRNPVWYRELCAEHPSSRGTRKGKFDTLIKRQHVIRALKEISSGVCKTLYAQRVMPYIIGEREKWNTK